MARIFPIHRTSLADPAREVLECALAALPEPWLALFDRHLASEDQRADAVLVHPGLGIALVNPVPNHPAAAGALRRLLERERFGLCFPGELPILAFKTESEDPETRAGRLQAVFDAAPRLDIEDTYWADAVVELLLEDGDLAMAPIGSQPSAAPLTPAASTAALPSEPETPINPANVPPRGPSFAEIRTTAADGIDLAGPLRLTELDAESPVRTAEEGWSRAQRPVAPAVARSFGWPSGGGEERRGRLGRIALLAAGIVCALVLPVNLPTLDETSPVPGRPPTPLKTALPPAAGGISDASLAKDTSPDARAERQGLGTASGSPQALEPPPLIPAMTPMAPPAPPVALAAKPFAAASSPSPEVTPVEGLPPGRPPTPLKTALPPAADGISDASLAKDTSPDARAERQGLGTASGSPQALEQPPLIPAMTPMAPPAPPVALAAKPFAAASSPSPKVSPVVGLPAEPPENLAAPTRTPAPVARAGEPTARPPPERQRPHATSTAAEPAGEATDRVAASHTEAEKPRRVARVQNPEQIRQPVKHAPADEGDERHRPPIDAGDLPALDPSTGLAAPADPFSALTAPPPGAGGQPDQSLGPPVQLTQRRIRPETGVGTSAPPTRPAQRTAVERPGCVPYISDKSLFGGADPVQGIACRDPDGRWRIVGEAPQR
jgi:hypothetical protein